MIDVILVSQSEHSGRKRVIAVLDRYALRIGQDTWNTPITEEGLGVLYKHLKKIATRQVSVTCFKRSPEGIIPLWSVGKTTHMQTNGSIPVHTHTKPPEPPPPHIKLGALVLKLSGYCHDLGKTSHLFQNKIREACLRKTPSLRDTVRHEWISLGLFKHFHTLWTSKPSVAVTQEDWDGAWLIAQKEWSLSEFSQGKGTIFDSKKRFPLENFGDLTSFLIASHHKLPKVGWPNFTWNKNVPLSMNCFINSEFFENQFQNQKKGFLQPKETLPVTFQGCDPQAYIQLQVALRKAQKTFYRINRITDNPAKPYYSDNYWFALSLLLRPALILADQERSSVNQAAQNQPENNNRFLFANTQQKPIGAGLTISELNQSLNWHLNAVGDQAAELLYQIHQFDPPSLSQRKKEKLLKAAPINYEWQNRVSKELRKIDPQTPTLMINMAGTGKGKTRMNMRALAELAREKPLRVATALNLRSLTLQTLKAYEEELDLTNEVVGVIGDQISKTLFEQSHVFLDTEDVDEDGNPYEEAHHVEGEVSFETPSWLKHALARKPKLDQLIMSPVAVCTADFLVKGMDLPKQANQAVAALRLKTSDLILDEIDSYDPRSLVSIMRMVMYSSFCGRNIIVSSATLSQSCAEGIFNAWHMGAQLRAAIHRADIYCEQELPPQYNVVVFDHLTDCSVLHVKNDGNIDFNDFYRTHTIKLQAAMRNHLDESQTRPLFKKAECIFLANNSDQLTSSFWREKAYEISQKYHNDHKQNITINHQNIQVSIGLIRVSNIRHAVPMAQYLSSQQKNLKDKAIMVCCYHSQWTMIQRSHIEKHLDEILTRKPKNGKDPLIDNQTFKSTVQGYLSQLQANHPITDLQIIVVATPVEEVGRDHDFDWAIIDPSSSQSIVQTAGRVNRHREKEVFTPNIGIMEYNLTTIGMLEKCDIESNTQIFKYPGLDTHEESYLKKCAAKHKSSNLLDNISMKNLINWDYLKDNNLPLDAGIKFDVCLASGQPIHYFAELDEESLGQQLQYPNSIFKDPGKWYYWFSQDFYRYFSLRYVERPQLDLDIHIDLQKDTSPETQETEVNYYDFSKKMMACKSVQLKAIARVSNEWIQLGDEKCKQILSEGKISALSSMDKQDLFTVKAQIEIDDVGKMNSQTFNLVWDRSFGLYKK